MPFSWTDAVLALVSVLLLIGTVYNHLWNRPFAKLQRALSVLSQMPAGLEREAWEAIVVEESRDVRRTLVLHGPLRDIRVGATLLVLTVAALIAQLVNIDARAGAVATDIPTLLVLILGSLIGILGLVVGVRDRDRAKTDFSAQEG